MTRKSVNIPDAEFRATSHSHSKRFWRSFHLEILHLQNLLQTQMTGDVEELKNPSPLAGTVWSISFSINSAHIGNNMETGPLAPSLVSV